MKRFKNENVLNHYTQNGGYSPMLHYSNVFNVVPSTHNISYDELNGYVIYDVLFNYLKDNGAKCVTLDKEDNMFTQYAIFEYENNLIQISCVYDKLDVFKDIESKKDKFTIIDDKYVVYATNITIYNDDDKISEELMNLMKDNVIEHKVAPTINIVTRSDSGYELNKLEFDPKLSDEYDLHYGKDFQKFHDTLINKISKTDKGLTLFHGEPGCGKTSYIKNLIKILSQKTKKHIIYLPSNLTNYLLDPEFSTFLLGISTLNKGELEVSYGFEDFDIIDLDDDEVMKANGIILIVEDSENVLRKRDGYDGQSTSNILNLTDGIMNDLFKIQIIGTYNTNNEQIDPALLRKGRLLAKREFKKLNIKEANKLAKHLNIQEEIKEEMSLADIYSMLDKSNDILIQEVSSRNEIGIKFPKK